MNAMHMSKTAMMQEMMDDAMIYFNSVSVIFSLPCLYPDAHSKTYMATSMLRVQRRSVFRAKTEMYDFMSVELVRIPSL